MNIMNNARIIVDLGYGDSGKGSMVDYYARRDNVKYVIRYNGGPQAAHNVVTPDGLHHTFAQYGAGTLIGGDVKTIISHFMLLDPRALLVERDVLKSKGVNTDSRIIVDAQCRIVTPFHKELNRTIETCRGNNRHSSCGMGVGLAARMDCESSLYVEQLLDGNILEHLRRIRGNVMEMSVDIDEINPCECHEMCTRMDEFDLASIVSAYEEFLSEVEVVDTKHIGHIISNNDTIFEGAQGVMLDEMYGFFPYVTKSNATAHNANCLIDLAEKTVIRTTVGVMRAYSTRHGNGPFVPEADLGISSVNNITNEWQGNLRHGHFDAVAIRYALSIVDVDELVMTNLDRLWKNDKIGICIAYEYSLVGDRQCAVKRGWAQIFDLEVELQFDLDFHSKRNNTLENCAPLMKYDYGFTNLSDAFHYIRDIEYIIDKEIDMISISPTHEGKIEVKNGQKKKN